VNPADVTLLAVALRRRGRSERRSAPGGTRYGASARARRSIHARMRAHQHVERQRSRREHDVVELAQVEAGAERPPAAVRSSRIASPPSL
jgi:hypothetical protein